MVKIVLDTRTAIMDSERALSLIRTRLQPGERLIWHSAPDPWTGVTRKSLFPLAFMTFWTGGVCFALYNGINGTNLKHPEGQPIFVLAAVIFVVVGGVEWVRTLMSLLDWWRTSYGLTDRRVIIAVGERGKTDSFSANALSDISRTGGQEKGTLLFDYGRQGKGSSYRNGLYGIAEPARVENLIYRTLITPNR